MARRKASEQKKASPKKRARAAPTASRKRAPKDKPEPKKDKGGRPRKLITEEQIGEVERMGELGMTEADIAHVLGVSTSTLKRRKKDQERVLSALKRGRSRGLNKVAGALMKSAMGGNVTAQIFFLKAQHGWREPSRFEISSTQLTADEVAAKTRAALAEADASHTVADEEAAA